MIYMSYTPINLNNFLTNSEPLTEEDILFLTSESVIISYTKTKQFRSLHSYLLSLIGDRYDKEIWVFITACGFVLKRQLRSYYISLNRNHYQLANKIHKKGINRDRMSYVLNWLNEHLYIKLYKGEYHGERGFQTCVVLHQKTVDMFHKLTTHAINRPITDLVVVKDTSSGEIITNMTKFKGVRGIRSLVSDFNTLLSSHRITLMGKACSASYKRIYADDLAGAGRWYSFGGLQTMRSGYRQYLKIDNNKTTEVDYKSIHPNILYHT